jgi:1,2-diacylglycerol 3-beta-galactosyltransferase
VAVGGVKRLSLAYFDGGGGHRSTALAIQQAVERQGLPWDVDLVNLGDVLDPVDAFRSVTGIHLQDAYNYLLMRGWTLIDLPAVRLTQLGIRLRHRRIVELLEREWSTRRPDLLVSLVPFVNGAMAESFAHALPGRPFVTVLTDIADYPPRFWIERRTPLVVVGSARAEQQARRIGLQPHQIVRSSGMIINPRFYDAAPIDRRAERAKLGLDPDRMTGLVLFGSHAPRRTILDIERRLDASDLPIQLIVICGWNGRLARELRARRPRKPRWVEGFTPDVPRFMQLSDFFIGKPGPASLAEALFMGLPVIVERNLRTLPQERYNTDWVRERDVGRVVRNFSQIADAVADLLEPAVFHRLQANARALPNRALFEFLSLAGSLLAD